MSFIDSHTDRNSLSLVCKSWYEIDRWCRRRVFIGNCYAVSPPILTRRFTNVGSITIKAKPHLAADYDELPEGWGAHALPWIAELSAAYPAALEEITFKRMVVTDAGLALMGKAFPNLTSVVLRRLNHSFPLEKLLCLLPNTPRLVDIGIGSSKMLSSHKASYSKLVEALRGRRRLKALSGLWDVHSYYFSAFYPVCLGITSLNLSCARTLRCPDLVKLLQHCSNLQRLAVLDHIEDDGLEELAASCKDLQELRLILSDPLEPDSNINLTEKGLISVAKGCPKLHYILYYCHQMTNAALVTVAKNRPNLTHFRLGILEPQLPDHLTHEPLDEGYAAIVEHCKELKRLSVTGLVTNRLLEHIGIHGVKLKALLISFAGDSDAGLHHILSGCGNLMKLEIRDCPFSDRALLSNAGKLEAMRFLWMSRCQVSYRACKQLAEMLLRLNVEVINERGPLPCIPDECSVENLYVYRTIAGPRSDMPSCVSNLSCRKESIR